MAEKPAVIEAVEKARQLPAQTPVEVQRGLKVRATSGGLPVVRLHYSAHPDRDTEAHPEWKKNERGLYTSQAAWDREQEIMDEAGGGELVFADTLITYWNKIVITAPEWRPHPNWRVEAGFDHGKTNATALLRSYHDYDGNIYFCGEYYMPGLEIWQHAPAMKEMADIRKISACYADPSIFPMTMQQAQMPGKPAERAKSVNELYVEQGIELFSPFALDRSDVSFAARLMLHWKNLDKREPSVFIVCRNYAEKPQPGMHHWDCPNLLWELMRTRRVKLTAQQLLTRNLSEAIVDRDNHARDACLVAGSLIQTMNGEVPIEDVKAGMEVLTRAGWRGVTAACMTSPGAEIWKVRLSNGASILGTGNHPIYTASHGFLRIDELKYGMLCAWNNSGSTAIQKSSTGWESTSIDTRTAMFATCGIISGMAASTYIRLFGSLRIAGQFLRSITSITKTAILSTMSPPTLKLCPEWFTCECHHGVAGEKKTFSDWLKCERRREGGIPLPKAGLGIPSMAVANYIRHGLKSVRSAAQTLKTRITREATPSALRVADLNGGDPIGSMTKSAPVNTVRRSSAVVSTARSDFALEPVQVLSVEQTHLRLPVYNVSVEGQPEYFANGILVHNCKYDLMSHPEPSVKTLEEIAAEAVKDLAAQGDLTSALIRHQQIMTEGQRSYQPARLGRRRR